MKRRIRCKYVITQPGRPVFDSTTPEGWKAEFTSGWLYTETVYLVCRQSRIKVATGANVQQNSLIKTTHTLQLTATTQIVTDYSTRQSEQNG